MIFAHFVLNLPTDVSALKSSISALERAISVLESDVKALESSSAGWEPWVWVFTSLVAVGVLMDLWIIRHDWRDEMEAWALTHFGVLRSPGSPSPIKLAVEIGSVVLIAVGVMGELGVGIEIASVSSLLRGKSAELRSKNAALRSLSDQMTALVSKKADDARLETALIEEALAWRTLSPHDEGLLHRRLWHITKQTFALSYNMGDAEAASFAWSIARTLDGADLQVNAPNNVEGWVRQNIPIRSSLGQQYAKVVTTMFGVVVTNSGKSAEEWKAGKSLVSVLTKCGFDATFSIGPPRNPSSVVVIFIATRPRGPQGEAKLKLEAIKKRQAQSEPNAH